MSACVAREGALRAGRHERALAQADAALLLSPNSTKAAFRRGQALQALGARVELTPLGNADGGGDSSEELVLLRAAF